MREPDGYRVRGWLTLIDKDTPCPNSCKLFYDLHARVHGSSLFSRDLAILNVGPRGYRATARGNQRRCRCQRRGGRAVDGVGAAAATLLFEETTDKPQT